MFRYILLLLLVLVLVHVSHAYKQHDMVPDILVFGNTHYTNDSWGGGPLVWKGGANRKDIPLFIACLNINHGHHNQPPDWRCDGPLTQDVKLETTRVVCSDKSKCSLEFTLYKKQNSKPKLYTRTQVYVLCLVVLRVILCCIYVQHSRQTGTYWTL